MTITIGPHRFDHATYDARDDVLYVRRDDSRPAADTYGTSEGHAVRFGDEGEVIGITVVNPAHHPHLSAAAGRPC